MPQLVLTRPQRAADVPPLLPRPRVPLPLGLCNGGRIWTRTEHIDTLMHWPMAAVVCWRMASVLSHSADAALVWRPRPLMCSPTVTKTSLSPFHPPRGEREASRPIQVFHPTLFSRSCPIIRCSTDHGRGNDRLPSYPASIHPPVLHPSSSKEAQLT
jgi:hypothetical protein